MQAEPLSYSILKNEVMKKQIIKYLLFIIIMLHTPLVIPIVAKAVIFIFLKISWN